MEYHDWVQAGYSMGGSIIDIEFSDDETVAATVDTAGSGTIQKMDTNTPKQISFGNSSTPLAALLLNTNGGVAAGLAKDLSHIKLRATRPDIAQADVVYTQIPLPPTSGLTHHRVSFRRNSLALCDAQTLYVYTLTTDGWEDGLPPLGVLSFVTTVFALPSGGASCAAMVLSHDARQIVYALGKELIWVKANADLSENSTLEQTASVTTGAVITTLSCTHNADYVGVNTDTGAAELWDTKTLAKPITSIKNVPVPVGAGEQGKFGVNAWELIAHADTTTSINVTSILQLQASTGTHGDWVSTMPSTIDNLAMSHRGLRLAVATSKTVTFYRGCVADMAAKRYNIPHNGYRQVVHTTLEQCRDQCCSDEICTMFQWIEAIVPADSGYPKVQCLLFSDDEDDIVEDGHHPFHTYLVRQLVPIESSDDDSPLLIILIVLAVVLLCCSALAAVLFMKNRKQAERLSGTSAPSQANKNNMQQEIDVGLLANEVKHDDEPDQPSKDDKKEDGTDRSGDTSAASPIAPIAATTSVGNASMVSISGSKKKAGKRLDESANPEPEPEKKKKKKRRSSTVVSAAGGSAAEGEMVSMKEDTTTEDTKKPEETAKKPGVPKPKKKATPSPPPDDDDV